MSRKRVSSILAFVGLLAASGAFAQSAATDGRGTADASGKSAQLETAASASAAASAAVNVERLRKSIEKKAEKVSERARAKAESKLDAAASAVDKAVAKEGEGTVAGRLGAEFGTSAEAMIAEQQQLDASWGDLLIAHTIASNAKTEVTSEQLVEWKHDGMNWGQLSAGLGLNLGSVVSSVNAESGVACGMARADGRVAAMTGEGARIGVGTNAAVGAGLGTGNAGASINAGVGAGVKIKP